MTDPTQDQTDAYVDECIRLDGALSPIIEDFAQGIEKEHAAVFDLVARLNRLTLAEWATADNDGDEMSHHRVANRMMLRALNSFAAAVILGKRGMEIEAQTQVRTIYECAFWLGWFHTEPDEAMRLFVIDSDRNMAQHHLYLAEHQPGVVPNDEIADADRIMAETKKEPRPSPKSVAEAADMHDSYVHYKWLCGMSAHASVSSLNRYMTEDRKGHEFDFSGEGIPKTLLMGCHALIEAFSRYSHTSKVCHDPATMKATAAEVFEMLERVQGPDPLKA